MIETNREIGTVQEDEFKLHNHAIGSSVATYTGYNTTSVGGSYDGISEGWGVTRGNGGNETRPRNVSVMYCIIYE